MTAHTYAPNPVGIRLLSSRPTYDATSIGPYNYQYSIGKVAQGTVLTDNSLFKDSALSSAFYGGSEQTPLYLYVENAKVFPEGRGVAAATKTRVKGTNGLRKVFLENGEWAVYYTVDYSQNRLLLAGYYGDNLMSKNFVSSLRAGLSCRPSMITPYNPNAPKLSDGSHLTNIEGAEYRAMHHYDRS